MKCPYCDIEASRVTGREIYPHRPDLFGLSFIFCNQCGAYVGCHKSGKPLGTLANAELREARKEAHRVFDPLWKSGSMTRTEAYQLLAKKLGIAQKDCHIAMFNLEQCKNISCLFA